MHSPARLEYHGDACLLPELRMVGWGAQSSASEVALAPHRHRGAFELCHIVAGSVEWWVEQQVFTVGPGQAFLTRPGERHGGVDAVLHPCELYWLQLVIPSRGPLPGLDAPTTRRLRHGLRSMPARHFPASPTLADAFARLLAEHRHRDPLSPVLARAALHAMLVAALRDAAATRAADAHANAHPSPPIRRALHWMRQHLHEQFTVEDAAAAAGLRVAQFHHRFRREVGFTPIDWRTRHRVERAKHRLLASSDSITTIAMDLGFASSQYFATVFRRHVGLSPRAYRDRDQARHAPHEER